MYIGLPPAPHISWVCWAIPPCDCQEAMARTIPVIPTMTFLSSVSPVFFSLSLPSCPSVNFRVRGPLPFPSLVSACRSTSPFVFCWVLAAILTAFLFLSFVPRIPSFD